MIYRGFLDHLFTQLGLPFLMNSGTPVGLFGLQSYVRLPKIADKDARVTERAVHTAALALRAADFCIASPIATLRPI